jgi:hypothetical protein
MKKEWKLIDKILNREKTIESRWYSSKKVPWDKVKIGETIYFKDSGDPISATAEVASVKQYENYSDEDLKRIIDEYGGKGNISFVWGAQEVFDWAKEKKYCILIYLKNPKKIEPFEINKKGFGNMASWICVEDINNIKA